MGYRTLSQALEIIKKSDRNSAITAYYLRCLAKSGKIKVLNTGNKVLINMKSLEDFLQIKL